MAGGARTGSELVQIDTGELRGDLATALRLAWWVFPALLHARSFLGIGRACQTHGPEPGGIFSPSSLGSLGAAGEHGLGDVNRGRGTLGPSWGTPGA